ncbi:hypothetical protein LITTLEDOG_63 [Serratia phage vB_SmaS_LittleDog]|uniref:Uncharacterized protein n=1 Tax=Serratia phage vB_SmaS_Bigdog TaxID=2777364 RepID=A0A7T3NA47_9CAUD|nr:hypothetical protein QJS28_gp65 [Serratia phage vB_SmaS_Bigdog]QPX75399.1 hypothetical protein [Serratia phage vB_SmaS_Opt-148]UGO51806.1 hypothetical protein SWAIN_61 [Serratia phage vB_SmaS_Swain]UGO51868.1 hypothetical protein CARROT_62 [Serratia phage vB_SmaS_Carrot]UGO53090.1 hypothetical protein LITTLEDOG_63 [Serratia phage vB_SmaS_LittleDog]QPX75169.1 hypothetical protein BIGDOG_65 [Serratia phage vB_SmaS_Bigdog]
MPRFIPLSIFDWGIFFGSTTCPTVRTLLVFISQKLPERAHENAIDMGILNFRQLHQIP